MEMPNHIIRSTLIQRVQHNQWEIRLKRAEIERVTQEIAALEEKVKVGEKALKELDDNA